MPESQGHQGNITRDDMEDTGSLIFYIIVGLIAIVSALVRKKKPEEGTASPGSPKGKTLEDVWKEIESEAFGTGEPADLAGETSMATSRDDIEPSVNEIVMRPEMEGAYSEPLATSFASEGQIDGIASGQMAVTESAISDHSVAEADLTRSYEINENKSEAYELAGEFDIRKAIIFSEILKRKEYL